MALCKAPVAAKGWPEGFSPDMQQWPPGRQSPGQTFWNLTGLNHRDRANSCSLLLTPPQESHPLEAGGPGWTLGPHPHSPPALSQHIPYDPCRLHLGKANPLSRLRAPGPCACLLGAAQSQGPKTLFQVPGPRPSQAGLRPEWAHSVRDGSYTCRHQVRAPLLFQRCPFWPLLPGIPRETGVHRIILQGPQDNSSLFEES